MPIMPVMTGMRRKATRRIGVNIMFYTFGRNNSGGSFVRDNDVSHWVIVEADSPNEANEIAESIGIYFNGVEDDRDCECCGDRWSALWDDEQGKNEPMVYDTPVADYNDSFTPVGEVYAIVYYKGGVSARHTKA